MSTREYLDEVIEVLKKEYGVSQERAERMIDDTYFAFKIEFNPYMYSDIGLSDVARLIVRAFSNPELRYQRFYDRVVEHLIRDHEVNANTAIDIMSFNDSKELFENNEEEVNKVGYKKIAYNLYDNYKVREYGDYRVFYNKVRQELMDKHGVTFSEANDILNFYDLELLIQNVKDYGEVEILDNIDHIAKSAIRYFVRHKYNELNGLG